MKQPSKTELLKKISELEMQLMEAEEAIDAIKSDKIDALVISTGIGDQIFTLEGADKPYRIFLEQMNEGAITISKEGVILYSNKSFADMINIPLENIIGTHFSELADVQDHQRLKSFVAESDAAAKEEFIFQRPDKSLISVYLSAVKLNIETIEPVLCIIATDLTEKKKGEEILAAEKLARSILEQSAEAIVVCDQNMRIIRANKAAENLAGESVLYKSFDSIFPLCSSGNKLISIVEIINKDHPESEEVSILNNEDKKYSLIITAGQLLDNQGEILGYVINLTNITKHIEAEEQLNVSLKEKTVLLKEIHHRVKNNLQIISSLLALQSAALKEEKLINILNECRNRISSMALIHQKLYESRSLASISISDYLRELINSLSRTYDFNNCEFNLDLPSSDFNLTIEVAIPLGLIMNELVTNALTHAFKKESKGIIDIKMTVDDGNCLKIQMKDNGIGFPQSKDFYKPDTLGLQLVLTLAQQLSGDIELVTSEGTEVKLTIPIEQ